MHSKSILPPALVEALAQTEALAPAMAYETVITPLLIRTLTQNEAASAPTAEPATYTSTYVSFPPYAQSREPLCPCAGIYCTKIWTYISTLLGKFGRGDAQAISEFYSNSDQKWTTEYPPNLVLKLSDLSIRDAIEAADNQRARAHAEKQNRKNKKRNWASRRLQAVCGSGAAPPAADQRSRSRSKSKSKIKNKSKSKNKDNGEGQNSAKPLTGCSNRDCTTCRMLHRRAGLPDEEDAVKYRAPPVPAALKEQLQQRPESLPQQPHAFESWLPPSAAVSGNELMQTRQGHGRHVGSLPRRRRGAGAAGAAGDNSNGGVEADMGTPWSGLATLLEEEDDGEKNEKKKEGKEAGVTVHRPLRHNNREQCGAEGSGGEGGKEVVEVEVGERRTTSSSEPPLEHDGDDRGANWESEAEVKVSEGKGEEMRAAIKETAESPETLERDDEDCCGVERCAGGELCLRHEYCSDGSWRRVRTVGRKEW